MAEIELTVKGMFCAGCAHHVKDALRSVPGVRSVTVNLPDGLADVVYDSTQADVVRMMGAVALAGYEAVPSEAEAAENEPLSLDEIVEHSPLEIPILAGIAGGLVLLALYLVLISVAESPVHALEQLGQDAWYVGAVALGFGAQIGLFVHLRTNISRAAASAALPAGSGGVSATAMLACCAHHVAEVLPFLGLSAAAVFLEGYRGWFMGVGLTLTAFGIGFMLYTIRKVNTGACAPANAAV